MAVDKNAKGRAKGPATSPAKAPATGPAVEDVNSGRRLAIGANVALAVVVATGAVTGAPGRNFGVVA